MGGGGEGYAARLFLLFSFPCSADHKRDWPPFKVVFRVGNQYAECEKQQQQLPDGFPRGLPMSAPPTYWSADGRRIHSVQHIDLVLTRRPA